MGQSLETQGEVALASIASEIVNVSCAAPDRTEACGRFVFNPATGALEITPAYRDKPAKEVMRELRRTKLRLYFMFARLYCLKFALQSRSAVLRLLRKAVRNFSYLVVKVVEQSHLDFQTGHYGRKQSGTDHGRATLQNREDARRPRRGDCA